MHGFQTEIMDLYLVIVFLTFNNIGLIVFQSTLVFDVREVCCVIFYYISIFIYIYKTITLHTMLIWQHSLLMSEHTLFLWNSRVASAYTDDDEEIRKIGAPHFCLLIMNCLARLSQSLFHLTCVTSLVLRLSFHLYDFP